MDVPDRLPYEVLERLYGDDGPPLSPHHQPRRAVLVVSSKKSGTFRPFVRVRPTDLIMYQALVDQLASDIEGALLPRNHVGAYRQLLTRNDDAFAAKPSNDEFRHSIRQAILDHPGSFVLETDISGYFLGIRLPQLEEKLIECSERPDVVYDVVELLTQWQQFGVRGLPQGIRPSSPLGNLYLSSLDRLLGKFSVPFFRWMDDIWAICDSYSSARRIQDEIEKHLYDLGLTLNGEKTTIRRAETAALTLEPAATRFERRRDAAVGEIVEGLENAEYIDPSEIPDEEEIDHAVTIGEHDRLIGSLDDEVLPRDFSADMSLVYRRLERLQDAHGLAVISRVLVRSPDLSSVAMRYAASLAKKAPKDVVAVFADVLGDGRFTRDYEKLNICHKALSLKRDPNSNLGALLGNLATTDPHPLIRAKALVAWGPHSGTDEFEVFDRFLQSAEPQWRPYALVSIQGKRRATRDERYEKWAGEGEGVATVAAMIRREPIKWGRL